MIHSNGATFPFAAIVGQDLMRLSLALNAINPTIGGVLIRGERGTAKSTAVRGWRQYCRRSRWPPARMGARRAH